MLATQLVPSLQAPHAALQAAQIGPLVLTVFQGEPTIRGGLSGGPPFFRRRIAWMHRLTRYVLSQLLTVFLFSLCAITFVTLTVAVLREAREQQLDMRVIVQLLPYILPDALRFAVPATILFSTCMVFGRMAASNEIVAMKSMGISPWRIKASIRSLTSEYLIFAIATGLSFFGYLYVQIVNQPTVRLTVYHILRGLSIGNFPIFLAQSQTCTWLELVEVPRLPQRPDPKEPVLHCPIPLRLRSTY